MLGGILLYQLNRRGSLVNRQVLRQPVRRPGVLLTPAFFILTVGLVFLRLFPLVLKLLAWVVARPQGASILIGMWQLVRNPVHYSRLVLLLMLATAVGMFAASFGATLNRSYADRAYVRSRLRRALQRRAHASNSAARTTLPTLYRTDRRRDSRCRRSTASSGSEGPLISRVSLDMLGVDPTKLRRRRLLPRRLREHLAAIAGRQAGAAGAAPETTASHLPADARWLGIWVNPVDMRSDIRPRDGDARRHRTLFRLPGWPRRPRAACNQGWNLAGRRPDAGPLNHDDNASRALRSPVRAQRTLHTSPTRRDR